MFCQKCGTQNPDNGMFCSKCGNNLKSNVAKVQAERKGISGKLGKMGIPGFRSGKTWKMALATFVYVVFLIGILSGPNKSPAPAQTPLNPIAAIDTPSAVSTQQGNSIKTPQPSQSPTIISSTFSDYGNIYCDIKATTLQKQTLFDENYKNKYVKWTGTVSSVSESWGSYKLQVKHCKDTFVSDIIVTMKDDQKSKLIQLKEGDTVTYTAKLTRYGDILGISADEGEIVT